MSETQQAKPSGLFPSYQKNNGEATTADDPSRMLWYSAGCGYFTDDWNKLKSSMGIPCCPTCGCPGMLTEVSKWEQGAFEFDKGNPGYLAFLKNNKEKCFKEEGGFLKAFDKQKY